MAQAKTKKTITLSLADDCILRPSNKPKNNLDGVMIDLTQTDDIQDEPIAMPAKSGPKKTIELNMNYVNTPNVKLRKSPRLLNMAKNSEVQTPPGCSKLLFPPKVPEKVVPDLIVNDEEFVCSLCYNLILVRHGVKLKACSHHFCRFCLVQKIYATHDQMTGAVKCPFEVEYCNKNLSEKEMEVLLGKGNFFALKEQIKWNVDTAKEREKRKKEEEKWINLPLLLGMGDLATIPNFEPFDCQICFTHIEIGQGIVLQNCLHSFCKECLGGLIEASDEFEVKCPHISNDVGCKHVLQEREMRALVTAEMFEKHLQKSLKYAENANEMTFHCRTPDCPSFVEIGEQGLLNFRCQSCNKVNCIPCKAIHEGKSCQDYQEDQNPDLKDKRIAGDNKKSEEAIQEMIAQNKAMYCPRCNIPVEKIAGCDYVMCLTCKLGLCWATKKPRKDLTKADGTIIEGCKCLEPPLKQRCHPKCGNCH